MPLEEISILNCSSVKPTTISPIKQINGTLTRSVMHANLISESGEDATIIDAVLLDQHKSLFDASVNSEYVKYVVDYIAGFVVYKLNKKLQCVECLSILEGDFDPKTLIGYKSKGFLKTPSKSVKILCERVEKEIRFEMLITGPDKSILTKNCFKKIIIRVQKSFLEEGLFKNTSSEEHLVSQRHYSPLLRAIVEQYLNVRYHFIAKSAVNRDSVRSLYNRMVLFKGM